MMADKGLNGLQFFAEKGWNSELRNNYMMYSGVPCCIFIDNSGNIIDARAPRPSENIRDLFLKYNIEPVDKRGYAMFDWVFTNNHLEICDYLIKANINISLLWASRIGYFKMVEYLVKNGADIETRDKDGNTPLIWASHEGYTRVVKYLVEKGANINAQSKDGWTSLHVAIYYVHFKIVKYLVEKGADLEVKNCRGKTPFQMICKSRYYTSPIKPYLKEQVEKQCLIQTFCKLFELGTYNNDGTKGYPIKKQTRKRPELFRDDDDGLFDINLVKIILGFIY